MPARFPIAFLASVCAALAGSVALAAPPPCDVQAFYPDWRDDRHRLPKSMDRYQFVDTADVPIIPGIYKVEVRYRFRVTSPDCDLPFFVLQTGYPWRRLGGFKFEDNECMTTVQVPDPLPPDDEER